MITAKNIFLGSTWQKCSASDGISFPTLKHFQNKICDTQFWEMQFIWIQNVQNVKMEVTLAGHTGSLGGPTCGFARALLRGTWSALMHQPQWKRTFVFTALCRELTFLIFPRFSWCERYARTLVFARWHHCLRWAWTPASPERTLGKSVPAALRSRTWASEEGAQW